MLARRKVLGALLVSASAGAAGCASAVAPETLAGRERGRAVTGRLDSAASCRRLRDLGWLDLEPPPRIPDRTPRYDDEELVGIRFFRTLVEGDLSGLTLPRTFFGRSLIKDASFRNTDLRESSLCWNDFTDVDFSGAVLSASDLRASLFERVSFAGADLKSADLRRSDFTDCSFEGASMSGAILARPQAEALTLSEAQHSEIDWRDDEGEEPGGG